MNGWIKLHRQLLDNPISTKPEWAWLWVVILLLASHEQKTFVLGRKKITLENGQFVTGRLSLAEKSGLSPSSVERALKFFESEQQIGQQKTTKYRLITILKWNDYQKLDSKLDSRGTATGQQRDTIKNLKKDKNYKNEDSAKAGETSKHNPLGSEIIKAFEMVDSKNKTYYSNTTQRSACDFLLSEYGLQEILDRIAFLPKSNKLPYFPKINSPNDLKEKWVKLEDMVKTKQVENLSDKPKVIFS